MWKPNVTVAAVVERDGRFLFVEEDIEGRRVLNQPAGHWDPGETLLEAVVRETWEETGLGFEPRGLVGIYVWAPPETDVTYLRFTFYGETARDGESRPPDPAIVRALWLTSDEARERQDRLRGPQVLRAIEDYVAGRRFPLDLVRDLA